MAMILIWQRRREKCEAILSKCKEEICRNPYADLVPYTRMIAAAFQKWKKAEEKSMISALFLELYAQDAQALRRDLCRLDPQSVLGRLKTLDTAKTKFPGRTRLLHCLYDTLAFYIKFTYKYEGDFSSVIAACGQGAEMDWKKYKMGQAMNELYEIDRILWDFQREACRDPEADLGQYVDMLMDAYDMAEAACVENLINTLFLNLYGQDAQSLQVYVAKRAVFSPPAAPPDERAELLPCLYGALASYIGEDFSFLIEMCDKRLEKK